MLLGTEHCLEYGIFYSISSVDFHLIYYLILTY